MHDLEVQKRFVQLRSQGHSFARIAQELNVSKQTLINWSRKLRFEIQNLRAIELEALREQLVASREVRARALADQLRRVEYELKKRSLEDFSTSRLYSLAASLRQQILNETDVMQFTAPLKEIPDDEYHELAQSWRP
jgi:uncharacterized protein (DUF849 family)